MRGREETGCYPSAPPHSLRLYTSPRDPQISAGTRDSTIPETFVFSFQTPWGLERQSRLISLDHLLEDVRIGSQYHIRRLSTACNSSSRGLDALCWRQWIPGRMRTPACLRSAPWCEGLELPGEFESSPQPACQQAFPSALTKQERST